MSAIDVAIGALQGGLGAYSQQLERSLLEESEYKRTENLNRLNRQNKYLASESGYETEEGRSLSVEQAEGYTGNKVNRYDAQRGRAIEDQKAMVGAEIEAKSSPAYTNFQDEMAKQEVNRKIAGHQALTAAGYDPSGKLIKDLKAEGDAKKAAELEKKVYGISRDIESFVNKAYPIPEGIEGRELDNVMRQRESASWDQEVKYGLRKPLTTKQARDFYEMHEVHHFSVPKGARDAIESRIKSEVKSVDKATEPRVTAGITDERDRYVKIVDGKVKYFYKGTDEEAPAPATKEFSAEDVPILGRVLKDYRKQRGSK